VFKRARLNPGMRRLGRISVGLALFAAVPDKANWSNLYGAAVAGTTVWAVGTHVDPTTDNNNALVLSSVSDGPWTVAGAPDPGSGSNIPGGITEVDGQLWMAGMDDDGGSELPLIEHHA
jgi:hypothetical protein